MIIGGRDLKFISLPATTAELLGKLEIVGPMQDKQVEADTALRKVVVKADVTRMLNNQGLQVISSLLWVNGESFILRIVLRNEVLEVDKLKVADLSGLNKNGTLDKCSIITVSSQGVEMAGARLKTYLMAFSNDCLGRLKVFLQRSGKVEELMIS